MKNRLLIGLSAVALLVLVAVQYVFITETYHTKQEQFDAKFGELVKEGMVAFNEYDAHFTLDSVLFLLDNLALNYLYSDADTISTPPAVAFHRILRNYLEPEIFLRDYIRKAGEDPVFSFYLQINELSLMDLGFRQRVYSDSLLLPLAPEGSLLAGSYEYEGNFFQIAYNVFIYFNNRSKLILNEMWLILSLAVLTLLFVFTIFFITLRNMLLQTRLSEMKTDFINNMTHELKTPLSTISVASSALGDRAIIQNEARVEELSGLIKRQNKHLSELIDRILDIHIWEKDEVRLKPKETQTEQWITQLVRAFKLEQGEKAPVVELEFSLGSPTHWFDEVHMSTVINNLLSNAVKYGNSPCRIRLEVSEQADHLYLVVSDNGPGIPREELKHIFEKFYRGSASKKRVIKGLGLGLYYVKQIVEAHKGSITVHSAPGKGTQFTIKIPGNNGSITG
jgi:signal transduction histidine kinase